MSDRSYAFLVGATVLTALSENCRYVNRGRPNATQSGGLRHQNHWHLLRTRNPAPGRQALRESRDRLHSRFLEGHGCTRHHAAHRPVSSGARRTRSPASARIAIPRVLHADAGVGLPRAEALDLESWLGHGSSRSNRPQFSARAAGNRAQDIVQLKRRARNPPPSRLQLLPSWRVPPSAPSIAHSGDGEHDTM